MCYNRTMNAAFPRLHTRLLVLLLLLALPGTSVAGAQAGTAEQITINDNRRAAGTLDGAAMTIRLEAREGEWHPDGDSQPGIKVLAFSIEGAALQIPGPLIRVTEGTEVRALVRNALKGEPLFLHGLSGRQSQPGATAPLTIDPGEVREIRFVAGAPGTYYYWAALTNVTIDLRGRRDSQLSGAFLVEPKGAPARDERVFVIGVWADPPVAGVLPLGTLNRMVMNGKSWPHTERLTYTVGDTVHIRLINAGGPVHPMHLHGFYFNVDSRGDEQRDVIFPASASPHMVNTERLAAGRTFSLTWKPTRAGNWLFHCHDTAHVIQALPLDGSPAPTNHHVMNHALEMMAGPVVGISVRATREVKSPADVGHRRKLRLVARVDAGGTADEPAYGFTLEDRLTSSPAGPPYLPGPTILLARNEPVSITVENRLPEPTAIHWHGIELESYYDGVAGFAGTPGRIAPAIAPGSSFEARFTPPRSGTFIYHTHVDEGRQQKAGLTGALVVVDSLASYDPEHDRTFLVTVPRRDADRDRVMLNGSLTPPTMELRAGERYRLRFVDIHTFRPSMRMRLLRNGAVLSWRALAKDGMDLPADQAIVSPSTIQMGNGETYDFEFVPDAPGDLLFDIQTAVGVPLLSMPVRVR
jgi:manganese oxidase